MTEPDLLELMLLYLLDSLDPGEQQSLARRLDAGEPEAVAALAEASELLAQMPAELSPAQPSPQAFERLMARVQTEEAAVVQTPMNQPTRRTPTPQSPIPLWPKLAIAASFVLGVGLTAIVVWSVMNQPPTTQQGPDDWANLDSVVKQQRDQLASQQQRLDELQTQLAQVQGDAELQELQSLIDAQRLAIAEQRQRVSELQESLSLLVGPGVRQAELAGGEQIPNAQGRLMWDPVTGQMRLLTRGLAELQPGETYQLWFVTEDGQTVSLGVFEINETAQTTAAYVATVPGAPSNIQAAAISIEPEGGSTSQQGPRGPIIMQGATGTE